MVVVVVVVLVVDGGDTGCGFLRVVSGWRYLNHL